MNEEIWKDIRCFPGYQVSSLGRVRSHNKVTSSARFKERHWKDRVLKQKVSKDRMHRVSLWNEDGEHTVLVHRLVADAFLEPLIGTKMTVNHKNGDRDNNTVENLEWLTLGDNIRHGFENGFYPSQKQCVLVDSTGKEVSYRSLSLASRSIGRNAGYISNSIIKGYRIFDSNGNEYFLRSKP